ncbi:hypothetical protein P4U23_13290 [Aeribacillus composti]|uniref:DUF7852 domain-containing protein n=1 Tax=Aeribacillus composti TaxID=1868734 RepID=UPI002E1B81E7|nr:hypothetical protein [Aeribacillus composti]
MKTPWIHHERMQQIRSKQMNIFKSSRVQKKSVCPNFQHTEEDDDSHKSDIVPNRIDTAEADDSHENYGIKKVTKLNKNKNNVSKLMNLYKKYNMAKRNHTGSICGPTQPSNGTTDPEHVSSTDDHTLKTDDPHIKQISLTSPDHETKEHPSADSVLEPVHTSSNSDEINDQEDDFDTDPIDHSVWPAHSSSNRTNSELVLFASNDHTLKMDGFSHVRRISLTDFEHHEKYDQDSMDSVFELVYTFASSSNEINDQEDNFETNSFDHSVELAHLLDENNLKQVFPAVDEHAVNTDEASHIKQISLTGLDEQETNDQPATNSGFELVHAPSSSDEINDHEDVRENNFINHTVEPVLSSDGADPEQSPSAADEHAVKTDEYFHADLEQDKKDHPADSAFESAQDLSSSDEINDHEDVRENNFINQPVHSSDSAVSKQVFPAVDEHAVNTDKYFHAGLEQEANNQSTTNSVFEFAHDSSGSDKINDQENIREINLINHTVEPVHSSDGADPEQSPSAADEHAVKTDEYFHADLEQDKKDHPADSAFEPAHASSSSDEMNDQDVFKINFINHTVELTRPLDIADSEQVPTTDVVRASKMDETSHAAGLKQDTKDQALTDSVFEPVHPSSESDGTNDQKAINFDNADESIKYGKTCSMTIKRPFSTFVEIDDFLHSPIFSSIVQNSAEFLDLNNKQTPQLNTKLLNTTTYGTVKNFV